MSTATEQQINFTADIEIKAADGKKPQVQILAYTGGILALPVGDVVVDLAGMEIPASIPLLSDHENARGSIIGQATASHDGKALTASGFLTAATAAGKELIALAKDGIRFQASIGAKGTEFERVRPGETVDVNGQQLQSSSPLRVARKSVLREISIVAIGVDVSTSVDIAAQAKGQTMADTTTATKTEDEIRGEERERIATIEATCKPPSSGWGEQQTHVDDLKAKAISNDITSESLNASMLGLLREARPKAPAQHSNTRQAGATDILECKLMLRAGLAGYAEKSYGADVCQQADSIHIESMFDISKEALRLSGTDVGGMRRSEILQAAFSGGAVPTLLGNTINRSLLQAYIEAPNTWASFAAVRSAKDFRDHTAIRPTAFDVLTEMPEGMSMTHLSVGESTYTWKIKRFARQLKVDEITLVNDDLSFLAESSPMMGRAAMRSVADNVFSTVMGNGGSFFSSGNSNLETGGGSALSGTSLGTVLTAFRSRRNSDGVDLDVVPKVLVVPPELEITAREILQSIELSRTATSDGVPIGNALQNALGLEVESRLSNTTRFSDASATAWYVFSGPQDAGVVLAFLEGRATPRVRTFGLDHDADQLAFTWTVDHNFGSILADSVAGHKADGA
jgi:hypothetical protein